MLFAAAGTERAPGIEVAGTDLDVLCTRVVVDEVLL